MMASHAWPLRRGSRVYRVPRLTENSGFSGTLVYRVDRRRAAPRKPSGRAGHLAAAARLMARRRSAPHRRTGRRGCRAQRDAPRAPNGSAGWLSIAMTHRMAVDADGARRSPTLIRRTRTRIVGAERNVSVHHAVEQENHVADIDRRGLATISAPYGPEPNGARYQKVPASGGTAVVGFADRPAGAAAPVHRIRQAHAVPVQRQRRRPVIGQPRAPLRAFHSSTGPGTGSAARTRESRPARARGRPAARPRRSGRCGGSILVPWSPFLWWRSRNSVI